MLNSVWNNNYDVPQRPKYISPKILPQILFHPFNSLMAKVSTNQWNGFYIIGTSVMKELTSAPSWKLKKWAKKTCGAENILHKCTLHTCFIFQQYAQILIVWLLILWLLTISGKNSIIHVCQSPKFSFDFISIPFHIDKHSE